MYKNRQLMRLNKVLHKGDIKTVDCIAPGHISFIEDRKGNDVFGGWVDLDDVEFILLTDETLLDLNIKFDVNHGCYTIEVTEGEVYYYINRNEDNLFTVGLSDYPVRFIHEMQNVLFWDLNLTLNMDNLNRQIIK